MNQANPDVDQIIEYESRGGAIGRSRMRTFKNAGYRFLLLTDVPVPPALPSITNNIERVIAAAAATGRAAPALSTIFEHYDDREKPAGQRVHRRDGVEDFAIVKVSFHSDGSVDTGKEPDWRPIAKSEVEAMIGGHLD